MTKWIRAPLIFIIFLSLSVNAQTLDILGKNSPYSPQLTILKTIFVHSNANPDSQTVGYLPKGAYISKDNESNGWSHIKFDYIDAEGDCSIIAFDKEARKKLTETYETKLKEGASDSEISSFMRGVLRETRFPKECFQHKEGWVKNSELIKVSTSPEPIKKSEACLRCSTQGGDTEIKGTVEKTKDLAKAIVEKVQVSDSGYASQPAECSLKSAAEIANKLRAVDKRANKQLPETESERQARKETEKVCNAALASFNKRCSIWRNKDQKMEIVRGIDRKGDAVAFPISLMRIEEVKNLSEKASKKLSAELGPIDPNALRCIAYRESANEPAALNASACQPLESKYNTDEKEMQYWRSTAFGLSQHVKSSIEVLWKTISTAPIEDKSKNKITTYQERYKNPEGVYQALWYDPYLHMELMGRHLKYLETYYRANPTQAPGVNCQAKKSNVAQRRCSKTKNIRDELAKAKYDDKLTPIYLAYDSDQANTWAREVMDCQQCLNEGKDSIGCLIKSKGITMRSVREVDDD